MRETCLYCEQKGVTTQLVHTSNHWRFCPVCEPDLVRRSAYPTVAEVLAHYGVAPVLLDKGVPNRSPAV